HSSQRPPSAGPVASATRPRATTLGGLRPGPSPRWDGSGPGYLRSVDKDRPASSRDGGEGGWKRWPAARLGAPRRGDRCRWTGESPKTTREGGFASDREPPRSHTETEAANLDDRSRQPLGPWL